MCVGFIIAVILSWIYDIHPEGGIVKTEPANELKTEEKQVSSNSWRIATYISFLVIAGLIVLNIIPRTTRNSDSEIAEILDKNQLLLFLLIMTVLTRKMNISSETWDNGIDPE